MNKTTFTVFFFSLFTLFVLQAAEKTIAWSPGINNYSTILQSEINTSSPGDKIKFESGKVYEFKSTIKINKGLFFESTQESKAILRMTNLSSFFFEILISVPSEQRTFIKNIEIDGNNNVNKIFESCLIFSHGKKLTIEDSTLRSGKNGIRAKIGTALHGLILRNTEFYNMTDICVLLLNRKTAVRRISEFDQKAEITGCHFENFKRGIICDNGNDFYNVEYQAGWETTFNGETITPAKRHNYVTNLKGTYIFDNTFTKWSRWCVGLVQAGNVIIHKNQMTDQKTEDSKSNGVIHLEQFTREITFSENIVINNIPSAKTFIDMAGGEAKRRLQNHPELILMGGLKDGSENGNCKVGLATENDFDSRTCRIRPHSYGQRKIYIYGNEFHADSNVNLEYGIGFHEVEDVFIGRKSDGTIFKNKWFLANEPRNKMVRITKMDQGVCNVRIADDDVSIKYAASKIGGPITKKIVSLNGNEDCIEIDNSTLSNDLIAISKNNENFSIYPNPTKNTLNITTKSNNSAYTLNIYNILGALIQSTSVTSKTTAHKLNVSNLADGLYFIQYINDNQIATKSFVIKK